MGYFDELYAGFFGHFSPLWDELERENEIIDVEFEDLSDQITEDSKPKTELLIGTITLQKKYHIQINKHSYNSIC